jgi:uncharacterized protein with HEPN domain
MRGSIGDGARISHIFDCINEIDAAIGGITFEQFNTNHVLKIAVVKWLEIIGEAAKHVTEGTKNKSIGIEWNKIVGLRNIVVHEYFGINYQIIWEAATMFLPTLKVELERIPLEE